jgi:hypothetical protein
MKTIDDVNQAVNTANLLNNRKEHLDYLRGDSKYSLGDLSNLLDRCQLREISRPLFRQLTILLIEQAIAGDKAKLLAMGIEVP